MHLSHHNDTCRNLAFSVYSYMLCVGLLANLYGNKCKPVYKNMIHSGVKCPSFLNEPPQLSKEKVYRHKLESMLNISTTSSNLDYFGLVFNFRKIWQLKALKIGCFRAPYCQLIPEVRGYVSADRYLQISTTFCRYE